MVDFTPGRQQDASSTIRGFWYQIQLTLLRWLNLATGEVLYLECGEDIDSVLRSGSDESLERELEQVKARERRITLRSAEALEALANFAAHIKANPGLALRFRFTTTASPSRERMSPIRAGKGAIDVWNSFQGREVWTQDDDATLDKLAHLITNSRRPKRCSEDAWDALLAVVRGTGIVPFREFVSRFEWSCGSARPEELRAVILERLGALPGCAALEDPVREQKYEQLLSALLELLSRAGPKRLSAVDLNAALARPTLSEHDRARIRMLEDRCSSHGIRLVSLEAAVQQIDISRVMPVVFGQAAHGLRAVDAVLALPAPPPLVSMLSRRQSTVDALTKEWISSS